MRQNCRALFEIERRSRLCALRSASGLSFGQSYPTKTRRVFFGAFRSPERGTHMKIKNETRQICRAPCLDLSRHFKAARLTLSYFNSVFASQHEKPNEGAGFFFLSRSRSICSSIVGSYVNVSTTQHPETRAKRSAVPIARIIISPFSFRYSGLLPDADAHHLEAPSCAFCESLFGTSRPLIASEETR